MRRELGRLVRRANKRPILVLFVTVLVVAGAVVRQARKRSLYNASVTFRVAEKVEGNPEENKHQTKGRLREYVFDGIFTKQRVAPLVQQLKLYPDLMDLSLSHAVEAFRDDIHVEVFKNYFLKEDLAGTGTPRTARIRIQFTYRDADVALKVARALGKMVQVHEADTRRTMSRLAAARAAMMAKTARRRLEQLSQRQMQLMMQARRAVGRLAAEARVQLAQLKREITAVEVQVQRAESLQGDSQLRAGLEKKQLLLRFELADWSKPPPPRFSHKVTLAITAVVLFFFMLPCVAIGIAAFDSRIYTTEDIRWMQLDVLGHIPAFKGDGIGAFNKRGDTAGVRSRKELERIARASRAHQQMK